MLVVPLQPIPSQTLQIQLASQACSINVYQTAYGLFLDLYVADVPVVLGAICENLNRIVHSLYLGFLGDLGFVDTQGTSDPVYTGLGARWQLIYLEQSDLPVGVG